MGYTDNLPGINKEPFLLYVDEDWFKIGDLLNLSDGSEIEVSADGLPYRKWYLLVFQYLIFGIYKAPWIYTVKIIKNEKTKTPS